MKNRDGAMDFESTINTNQFNRAMDEMEARIKGLSNTALVEGRRTENLITGIIAGAAGMFTIDAALDFRNRLIDVRGEFQKYEAVLTNSLKSHDEALRSMEMLKDMASSTPYQLDKLTESYVKLVNQGFKPTKAEITQMGDLSASVSKDFGQLTEAILDAQTGEFERLKEFGIKASKSGEDIIFTFRGISTEVKNTSADIREYILSLGNMEGIRGSMDAISKTLVGQVSNLEDAITNMLNEIGESNEGLLSGSISAVKLLVDNYQTIGKVLEGLIITYGSYKAAVIAMTVIERTRQAIMLEQALAGKALTAWEALHSITLKRVQAAQAMLNRTMLANPYALVAAALAAVISYMVLFRKHADEISEAQKQFKADATQTLAEVTTLFDQLRKTNAGTEERRKVIEQLNLKYGEYLGNLNLEKAGLLDIEKAEKLAKDAALDRMAAEGKIKDLTAINQKKLSILQTLQEAGLTKEDIAEIKRYIEEPINNFTSMNVNGMKTAVPVFKSWGHEIDLLVDNYGNLIDQGKQVEKQWDDLREAIGAPISASSGKTPGVDPKAKKQLEDYKDLLKDMASELEDEYELLEKLSVAYADKDVQTWLDAVDKEIEAFERKGKKQAEVLEQTASLYNKLAKINEDYAEKERLLKETAAPSELENRLQELNRQKQADIDSAKDEAFRKTEIYKQITQNVISEGKRELNAKMGYIKKALETEEMSADKRLELLRMLQEAENKLNQESLEELNRKFESIALILGTLANSIGDFNEGLAKTVNSAANLAGNLGNAIAGFMPGGDITRGISGVIGVISSLAEIVQRLFSDKEDSTAKRLEEINRSLSTMNRLLQSQIDIIGESYGEKKVAAYLASLTKLKNFTNDVKKKINELSFTTLVEGTDEEGNYVRYNASVNNLLNTYIEKYGDIKTAIDQLQTAIDNGLFTGDTEAMTAYLDQLKENSDQIAELQRQYSEYITGTSINELIDKMTEMFEQGKTSAADFADTFENLMSKALLQAFRIKMLEGPLTAWFEQYSAGISQGAYNTSYFLIGMQEKLEKIGADAQAFWDQLEQNFPGIMAQITGISTTGADTSLTGAVKGVTEETASLIAGQMNAIRMNQAESLENMKQGLVHLANIDKNTRELYPIRKAIENINRRISTQTAVASNATGTLV